MKKFYLSLTGIMFLFNFSLNAQTTEQTDKLKTFGIGIEVSKFSWSDIYSNLSNPVTSLTLTINPQKNFRIQPVIGSIMQKSKSDFFEEEVKSSAINFGLGLFGLKQKDKVAITYGLDFNYMVLKDKYEADGFDDDITTEGNALKIGPALGAEYFFSPNFSFGANIGLKYFSVTNEAIYFDNVYGGVYPDKETITGVLFDSGLLVRVYF